MQNNNNNCHCESNEAIQKSWNNHLTSPVFFKKSGLNQAFTLVELIVVITILAILWTIAFISFQNYTSNARDWVRIADLNSIKKNLELFITEKWFYPTPDNVTNITYSWAIAWSQWTVWDNVITNLARLNKKPTDPLTNSEYTYSITNAKTEYQLSSINEWWLSYDIPLTNQTYAATLKTATAKVTWSYNEKLLKVSTGGIDYILAVPSIINADLADTSLQSIINNRKLVYNNYQNLPDSYKNTWYTMTWWFNFAPPSNIIEVYTWSLTNLLNSGVIQQQFITKLQSVYNTTILQSEPGIKEILFATSQTQQQTLVWNYITNHVWWITGVNTVVTQTQTYSCSSTQPICSSTGCTLIVWNPTSVSQSWVKDASNCWFTCNTNYSWTNCETYVDPAYIACTWIWQIKTATTTYWTCNAADIVVCAWTNTWYTLAACNVWTSIAWTWFSSYWYYFQWWNNWWTPSWAITPNSTRVDASLYWPWTANWYYNNTTFIWWTSLPSPYDWTNPQNNNLWGDTIKTSIARQWPCIIGYHIPSQIEWQALVNAWWWGSSNWTNMMNTLKLPMAGSRNMDTGNMNVQSTYGYYWLSSISGTSGGSLTFYSTYIGLGGNLRPWGYSLRCIKN
jgi:prepilin-type N-terminal cleavage/methylation domain-containing protein